MSERTEKELEEIDNNLASIIKGAKKIEFQIPGEIQEAYITIGKWLVNECIKRDDLSDAVYAAREAVDYIASTLKSEVEHKVMVGYRQKEEREKK